MTGTLARVYVSVWALAYCLRRLITFSFRENFMKETRLALQGINLPDMWRKSGKTQEEFSRENNVSVHRLRYWLYKKRGSIGSGEAFIELGMPSFGQGFVIRYPNGVELSAPALTPLPTLTQLAAV
jgi:hypothetical protein